jgi:hypothetical protein
MFNPDARARLFAITHNIRRAEHVDPLYLLAELREGVLCQCVAAQLRDACRSVSNRDVRTYLSAWGHVRVQGLVGNSD